MKTGSAHVQNMPRTSKSFACRFPPQIVPERVLLSARRRRLYVRFVPLFAFLILQAMDAVTTLIFLRFGIEEGNPLIRAALSGIASPEAALAFPKLFAVALGVFAWRSGRLHLLRKMNVLF